MRAARPARFKVVSSYVSSSRRLFVISETLKGFILGPTHQTNKICSTLVNIISLLAIRIVSIVIFPIMFWIIYEDDNKVTDKLC